MSELNLSELKFTEIDIKNFVNSSLDVEEGSVLFINHDDKDKLDKYVDESLKKKVKLVITSLNCSLNDDKVIKAKNYNEVLLDSMLDLKLGELFPHQVPMCHKHHLGRSS